MKGYSFWYGREVEGRYTDLHTVFMRSKIPSDVEKYFHLYFTFEAHQNGLLKKNWDKLRAWLDKGKAISIEVYEKDVDTIPADIFNRAHLLLRIQSPASLKLKKTDTICLHMAEFRILTITKFNMQETQRETYIVDSAKPYL